MYKPDGFFGLSYHTLTNFRKLILYQNMVANNKKKKKKRKELGNEVGHGFLVRVNSKADFDMISIKSNGNTIVIVQA